MIDPSQSKLTLSEAALDRMETLCEDFELHLRAGHAPRIEQYLEKAAADECEPLLRGRGGGISLRPPRSLRFFSSNAFNAHSQCSQNSDY
jgi:hypothetical protein